MTPFDLALRYTGIHELKEPGKDHPLIQWWLSLCEGFTTETPDETPWCSAFVNGICWELGLQRSGKANARSWLKVGAEVLSAQAIRGNDIVVLQRGDSPWQGHVGFFSQWRDGGVELLGGNQGDQVKLALFNPTKILGIRRV